jgi:hypothetical protein
VTHIYLRIVGDWAAKKKIFLPLVAAAFVVAVALAADLVVLPFLLEAFAKRRLPQ